MLSTVLVGYSPVLVGDLANKKKYLMDYNNYCIYIPVNTALIFTSNLVSNKLIILLSFDYFFITGIMDHLMEVLNFTTTVKKV